ncbi:asparagine synthase (glutamine-hydrolyzing) [Sphingomonas sp. AR_OL41]|uniref:asparagine synthase (glutamine-hydrolyzing) n=1 Tax=Sphingomonas sp. AR_OL41 TaxID=3042729 RepID=UPI0024807716|nr:asparagine synthase (glutamine-hydrolyzing) [Sphingomonas sp. AR_OL41]MDH7974955.1 asparagine synthase (glutamine-hydrolyzing) [Sphingomonas sp. AR_OL41]
MCGFSVIIDRSGRPIPYEHVEKMNDAVAHRGPDASGVATYGSIGLGHRRLSIIDLSHAADQPMVRPHGTLVYNGEIYNFRAVRADLEALGVRFATDSDSEVLLEALNQWWVDALPRLNGMFAFAYLDHRSDRLLLGRDQFGIKPLFVAEQKGLIVAGSEIKQAFSFDGIEPRINEAAASAFLFDSALNRDEGTLFDGVKHLLGGHYAIYDRRADTFVVTRWYDLQDRVRAINPSYPEARERIGELMRDSVRLRHASDVPIGSCLSGGIDSSVICSLSGTIVDDPSTFSVFTTYHESAAFDERYYSRQVVEKFGFRSIEILPDLGELFSPGVMSHLAWYQDQPFLSGSHFNEYIIFKAAHERGVTVILDGQGSDEYFGGYGEFWFAAQIEALRSFDIARFSQGISARAVATSRSTGQILRLFASTVLSRGKAAEPAWIADGRRRQGGAAIPPHSGTNFVDLAVNEMTSSSLPYQLHSEDRNSMRWSIEARLPMLDHRLVEYALSIPTAYKVGAGYQKRVLRDATPELPTEIATRRAKMGFVSADSEYILHNGPAMRTFVEAAATRLSGRVDAKLVIEEFDAIIAGGRRYHDGIFRLLSLVAWADAFKISL